MRFAGSDIARAVIAGASALFGAPGAGQGELTLDIFDAPRRRNRDFTLPYRPDEDQGGIEPIGPYDPRRHGRGFTLLGDDLAGGPSFD